MQFERLFVRILGFALFPLLQQVAMFSDIANRSSRGVVRGSSLMVMALVLDACSYTFGWSSDAMFHDLSSLTICKLFVNKQKTSKLAVMSAKHRCPVK